VEYFNKEFCLDVRGDYACFTRPEMKVERVSYDVITPSAARAVFEAIFWKPAVRWHVRRIEILKPISWASVRRNEVGAVMSARSPGLFIEDVRQQRAGLFLRDVAYRLYAELEFIPPEKRTITTPEHPVSDFLIDAAEQEEINSSEWRSNENPGKYNAIFERRARKGQCFNQPYLGCREFSCSFRLVQDPSQEQERPIDETRDLGFMLYDMDFSDPTDPKPAFFRAKLENGVVMIPSWDSEEVRR
jgi:CRISPR-associated protein Cas5d